MELKKWSLGENKEWGVFLEQVGVACWFYWVCCSDVWGELRLRKCDGRNRWNGFLG